MKATKFVKTAEAMCKGYSRDGALCKDCPLRMNEGKLVCGMFELDPKQVVKSVKAWAKMNNHLPVKKPAETVNKGMELKKFDELTLKEFVKRWMRPNTLVRLWVPNGTGHNTLAKVTPSGEDSMVTLDGTVGMSWAILDGTGWQARFSDWRVMYIADILCDSTPEAVNIVLDDCEGCNGCC